MGIKQHWETSKENKVSHLVPGSIAVACKIDRGSLTGVQVPCSEFSVSQPIIKGCQIRSVLSVELKSVEVSSCWKSPCSKTNTGSNKNRNRRILYMQQGGKLSREILVSEHRTRTCFKVLGTLCFRTQDMIC